MSTEKMRHDFEQFIIRRDGSIWVTIMGDQRSYSEPIERDFSVWCESRAAIEVELPEIKGFEGAYDSYKQNEFVPFMNDVDDADEIFGLMRGIEVREAIESLGLKVKS